MAEAPAQLPTAHRTVDAKGLLCPMPIVRLSKAVREMDPGEVVLLEATDPGAVPDVAAWSRSTGNPVLHQDQVGGVMRFWIQKG
jgi:tRNA 2-thiouridine synthesizing protein A